MKNNDILDTKTSSLASNRQENENQNKKIKKKNKIITGLSIATGILALSTTALGIAFGIADSKAMDYHNKLENVYQSNLYSLIDSVNNLENKLSKTISANGSTYQRKTLLEASQNASEAEISIASLPLSQSDIQDTVKMVNQISGYTTTLADNLAKGGTLSEDEISTLTRVHESVVNLQNQLNEFARKMERGYSILDASLDIDTDSNGFSRAISSLKNNDIEYPTMIYDGPFSDSVVNSNIKGLKGDKISKEEAATKLEELYKNAVKINYQGETNGKFSTYNYRVTNSNEEELYIQMTQIEGHILTISGAGENGAQTIDYEAAKNIALEFAKENGIEDGEVVWNDTIKEDVYLNIAPKGNGIILYPDLVKVKVNLVSGTVVGYDATSYFTNHTARTLSKGSLSLADAKGKVPSKFTIENARYVLSPLDYNREVVCVEVEATGEGSTYYFYYNASDGSLENVLKVIETDDGNLLM